jgi:hypothetical protein
MSLFILSTRASKRNRAQLFASKHSLSCKQLAKRISLPTTASIELTEILLRKAWSYELCYDPTLEIGHPLPAGLRDQTSLEYSPFVFYIDFAGALEDETQWIDQIMTEMSTRHSIIHRAGSGGLVFLTRDQASLHVRTACNIDSICKKGRRCVYCWTLAQAVYKLVQDLCVMVNAVILRQIQYATEPYPTTAHTAFRELLTLLLCDFGLGYPGVKHIPYRDGKFRPRTGVTRSIIASTWQSGPYPGCIYSTSAHTIIPRSVLPDARCGTCLEPFTSVAILQIPCKCLLCEGCLSGCFRSALLNRQSFPPKCCGQELLIQQYIEHLLPDVVRAFVKVAAEYRATSPHYCADPACSTFISTALCDDENCLCPSCYKQTCVRCMKLVSEHAYEPDRVCPRNSDEQKGKKLAKDQNWATCPGCNAVVERSDGCNHMRSVEVFVLQTHTDTMHRCHCGQRFCYACNLAYVQEPECHCGLGLGYLQEEADEESDAEESEDEEPVTDEEDDVRVSLLTSRIC